MYGYNAKAMKYFRELFLTAERSTWRSCLGTGGLHGVEGAQGLDLPGRWEVGRGHGLVRWRGRRWCGENIFQVRLAYYDDLIQSTAAYLMVK